MNMKRLPRTEASKLETSLSAIGENYLELLSIESDEPVVLWPETVSIQDPTVESVNHRELDLAFICSSIWRNSTGWLSTAVTFCLSPELILYHSKLVNRTYTDTAGNLLFDSVDVKEYFQIIKQKLEHYQLEDMINQLPDGDKLMFRV